MSTTEAIAAAEAPDVARDLPVYAMMSLPELAAIQPVMINKGTSRSASIGNLAMALANVQGEMKNPPRSKEVKIPGKDGRAGYTFMYAELSTCLDAVRPMLKANGLALVQSVSTESGRAVCTSELIHKSGEWYRTELQFAGAGDIKNLAGTLTYLRRYGMCALLGIAPEDDVDGGEEDHGKKPETAAAGNAAGRARAAESKAKTSAPPVENSAKPEALKPAETSKPAGQRIAAAAASVDAPKADDAAQNEERKALSRQLWTAVQTCDAVYRDGKIDNPDCVVKGDWRMRSWGLKPLANQPVEEIKSALQKYTELHELQKKLYGWIDSMDAVTDENGVVLPEPTAQAANRRLLAMAEANPGQVGTIPPHNKVPSVDYCTEDQLRWLIAQYEQAGFTPEDAVEVPF